MVKGNAKGHLILYLLRLHNLEVPITLNQEQKESGDKNSAISLLFTSFPPQQQVLDITMLDSTDKAEVKQFYVTDFTVHKLFH